MGGLQLVEGMTEERSRATAPPAECMAVQPAGFLLELSLDWIVLRASENAHRLLGESHVTLIDEPLGRFVQSQALHDLRNLFSRLSGTTGIARAYDVRLTDEQTRFDIAFQQSEGRVVLEAVSAPEEGYGEAFGSVGGLVAGLAHSSGEALLDAAARRFRALTGYDRVTLTIGDRTAESSRGAFAQPALVDAALPPMIADAHAEPVPIFPRESEEHAADAALLCAPSPAVLERLRSAGVRAALRVPITRGREILGHFHCESRTPRRPRFELHAAAELFAQMFALQLEIDELKSS